MTKNQIEILHQITLLIQQLIQSNDSIDTKPIVNESNPFYRMKTNSREFVKQILWKFGTEKTNRNHPFVVQCEREKWVQFSNLMQTLEQRGLVVLEWENCKTGNGKRKVIKSFQFTKNFG